jgi:hypothetical protein
MSEVAANAAAELMRSCRRLMRLPPVVSLSIPSHRSARHPQASSGGSQQRPQRFLSSNMFDLLLAGGRGLGPSDLEYRQSGRSLAWPERVGLPS